MVNNKQIGMESTGTREPLCSSRSHPSPRPSTKSVYQIIRRNSGPEKNNDTMLSCRYELKYRIRESKARAIAEYIRSYLPIDHYARKSPNHEYPISSLYFDSSQLHLCRETLDRKSNRFKLRVRCYDDNPESPCFVEIKRRLNRVIVKDRARLPKQMLERVIQQLHVPDSLHKKDAKKLRQFQFYLRTLCARPLVLVRYMRQAFEGDCSNRVRVTFDRHLSFKPADRPVVTVNGGGWHRVSMDFVILEIKFTSRYPHWLSDMVKVFDLKQSAMSKYVSSVKQFSSMGLCAPMDYIGV